VPGQVGLLRSVTDLDLSHNAIEFLPDTIGGLNELVKFDCSHNRLRRLPETICGCPRLETLRAAANRIDQMPLRIAEMSQLKILDLASNIIEIIPQDLSRLPNIQIISLGKNRIKSLPLDLANLSDTLDELHLDRNPLSDLPKRWASKLSGTAHQRAMWPSGYDDEAAMDWVRDHARFYAHALAEWEVSGPLHISGRANLSAYEAAVRRRCGGAWEPHLVPMIRSYYFRSRRTGNAPKFHRLAEDEVADRDAVGKRAQDVRDARHSQALEASLEHEAVLDDAYHGDVVARADEAERRLYEWREPRALALAEAASGVLAEEVARRRRRQDARHVGIAVERRRDEGRALAELRAHLRESFGEPDDGLHFFPPLYAPSSTLRSDERPVPEFKGYSMFRNRASMLRTDWPEKRP